MIDCIYMDESHTNYTNKKSKIDATRIDLSNIEIIIIDQKNIMSDKDVHQTDLLSLFYENRF